MSLSARVHFKMMSLVHETLYSLIRDPFEVLQAAGLKSGQEVLEVGCGPGFFTVPAAEIVGEQGKVVALDINPLAVEKVRTKVEQAGVANVEIILADAARTSWSGERFDLAFVFGFENAIGDVGQIFEELHRLLKPGGTLAVDSRMRVPDELFFPFKRQGRIAQFKRVG